MRKDLEVQTKNAMEFVQKLYFEISYLIKEVEGILQQEEEEFIIGRPSGYGVTTRTSIGLEPVNVELWLSQTFTVFFSPKENINTAGGQTITKFDDGLKILLLDIELMGKKSDEPRLLAGCLRNLSTNRPATIKKFESTMATFAYRREKVFSDFPEIKYEDSYVAFDGKFIKQPLFAINDSTTLKQKVVDPMLKIFQKTVV